MEAVAIFFTVAMLAVAGVALWLAWIAAGPGTAFGIAVFLAVIGRAAWSG